MTKKTFSKVVAAICVVALMFTAVFTGVVSADNRTATCTLTGYTYSPGAIDTYVGYEVKFESNTAFVAGQFEITSVPSDLRFVDCIAKVSNVANGYVPNVALNVSNNKVLFYAFDENAESDIQPMTSLTLILNFTPDTAIKDSAAGTTWPITVGNIAITNAAEETYTCDGKTASAHIHNFTIINAQTANGVTTRTCSVVGCGAIDKTIAPGEATLGSNDLAGTKKATLQFTADGDTVLCALVPTSALTALGGTTYFVYSYKDDSADEKTATSVAAGTIDEYTVFPCGRNGGIGRMSRNIKGNFINVNGTTTISADWTYSIKQYLDDVIAANSDAKAVAYAKALWNFGYYTTDRLVNDSTHPQPSFQTDLNAYTGGVKSIADWPGLSEITSTSGVVNAGTGDAWKITGVKVTTGFKPKMQFKLDTSGSATVEAYSEAGDLVYKKTVDAVANTYFTISDIPTKYLTGNIKVTLSTGTRSLEYSFGKYAKARQGKTDGDVFKWMMNYSYYLGQKFA